MNSSKKTYNIYRMIVITFIVTGIWDVILRFITLYNPIPYIHEIMPFMKDLKPYFQKHTLLAAALIAGFVGASVQYIILNIMNFPTVDSSLRYNTTFMLVSFIISALYGFIMKATKLFPYLDKYYYEKLGVIRSLYHDGISGIIVQITLLLYFYLMK
jgi:hypothetical protein